MSHTHKHRHRGRHASVRTPDKNATLHRASLPSRGRRTGKYVLALLPPSTAFPWGSVARSKKHGLVSFPEHSAVGLNTRADAPWCTSASPCSSTSAPTNHACPKIMKRVRLAAFYILVSATTSRNLNKRLSSVAPVKHLLL